MRRTQDERGHSFWDIFPDLEGQVNISFTKPGQRRGFHLHRRKTDHWVVLRGEVRLVTATIDYDLGGSDLIFSEQTLLEGDTATIAPGLWHALEAIGKEPTILAYYETAKSGVERDDDYEMDLEIYGGWN